MLQVFVPLGARCTSDFSENSISKYAVPFANPVSAGLASHVVLTGISDLVRVRAFAGLA